MKSIIQERLCKYEGKIVHLTSMEGEVITARVLSASDTNQDVVVDVRSTNQPERYERLGKSYNDGAWAIPFEYIQDVEPQEGTAAESRGQ
ncbi:MAG: hypothetical protein QOG55_865 [Acidobacteriaceae bacterium]|jgi:hypothetical protein|nr:hypothetical protein [Acidobacteriaceae bacterium]